MIWIIRNYYSGSSWHKSILVAKDELVNKNSVCPYLLYLNQNAEAQLICPPGSIEQITDDPVEDSRSTSINADGTRIAFSSTANINGGNPEGNSEIYYFDTTTGIFTQITDETEGESRGPSIDADGTRIAFRSDANINGGNIEGNFEIYLSTCLDLATTGGSSCALASPGATNFSTPRYIS